MISSLRRSLSDNFPLAFIGRIAKIRWLVVGFDDSTPLREKVV